MPLPHFLMPTRARTPCPTCNRLTPPGSIYCPTHDPRRAYRQPEYRRLSRLLVEAHVATNGWVCPGDEDHQPHPSRDLTVDHIIPVTRGGQNTPPNLRILCRRSNSARGGRGGVPSRT
jgi:5-methylcytosine-specific restriction endonuclease McrA